MVGSRLQIAGSPALDLHTAASLLLDVLHISTTMPDDLSAQVKTVYRLKAYRNFLLGPFALNKLSAYTLYQVVEPLLFQTRHVQPAPGLGGGNVSRLQAEGAPAG